MKITEAKIIKTKNKGASQAQPLKPRISLIVPVFNEAETLADLIDSIKGQTFPPAEIIFVDGGSTDQTVELFRELTANDGRFKIIEAGRAYPGRGRNIGAENAGFEWIAFTDAGIRLERTWLEHLVEKIKDDPAAEVVYGNYEPVTDTFFEKCASLAYVQPKTVINGVETRGRSIASALMKREVWQKIGGFPNLRAAEDLLFMNEIERQKFKAVFAPRAVVWWHLRPTLGSTFKKFVLYSKNNVWAGLAKNWQYGVAKQYLLLVPFIALAIVHSRWWLLALPLWLGARTAKTIWRGRGEHGWRWLLNPVRFVSVAVIIIVIDAAMFIGWGQSLLQPNEKVKTDG